VLSAIETTRLEAVLPAAASFSWFICETAELLGECEQRKLIAVVRLWDMRGIGSIGLLASDSGWTHLLGSPFAAAVTGMGVVVVIVVVRGRRR
jgi:hypothetical protein